MSTQSYTVIAYQGSRLQMNLNLQNSDSTYINLSGYSCSGVVKHRYSSDSYILNLNPVVHTGYTSGLINIDIPSTGMVIPAGQFVYDVEIYQNSTGSLKVLRGNFKVEPDTSP